MFTRTGTSRGVDAVPIGSAAPAGGAINAPELQGDLPNQAAKVLLNAAFMHSTQRGQR